MTRTTLLSSFATPPALGRLWGLLATLLFLVALAISGCQQRDATARGRIEASAQAKAAPQLEAAPPIDAGRALKSGKALGQIDRFLGAPMGKKLND